MAKISTFLAGAVVGAAAGAVAGAVLRPHLRTLAKTAISSYYAGKRHAAEFAARVAEEIEDIQAEIGSEKEAAASETLTADSAAVERSERADENSASLHPVEDAACDDSGVTSMTARRLRDQLIGKLRSVRSERP